MNYRTLIAIVLCLWMPFAVAGPFSKEANENPFLRGELNPQYEGELTALGGEVLEIKPTRQKFPVYKINLRIEGIKNIWVTSIAPEPEGGIKVGDMMIFKVKLMYNQLSQMTLASCRI